MTISEHEAPSPGRRALVVLALLATAALVVVLIAFLVHNLPWLIVALVGLAVAVAGVWWALTERKLRRGRQWCPNAPGPRAALRPSKRG